LLLPFAAGTGRRRPRRDRRGHAGAAGPPSRRPDRRRGRRGGHGRLPVADPAGLSGLRRLAGTGRGRRVGRGRAGAGRCPPPAGGGLGRGRLRAGLPPRGPGRLEPQHRRPRRRREHGHRRSERVRPPLSALDQRRCRRSGQAGAVPAAEPGRRPLPGGHHQRPDRRAAHPGHRRTGHGHGRLHRLGSGAHAVLAGPADRRQRRAVLPRRRNVRHRPVAAGRRGRLRLPPGRRSGLGRRGAVPVPRRRRTAGRALAVAPLRLPGSGGRGGGRRRRPSGPGSGAAAAVSAGRRRRLRRVVAAAAAGVAGRALVWVAAGRGPGVSLLGGPFPRGVEIAAAGCWAAALGRGDRRWWRVTLPVLVGVTVAVVGLTAGLLHWTGTVNDHYPPSFALWVGSVILAGLACPVRLRQRRDAARTTAVAAAVAVLAVPLSGAAAFLLINDHYGYWPARGDLVGNRLDGQLSATQLPAAGGTAAGSPPSQPARGRLAPLDIPATSSGFAHMTGSVYLPPAFFAGRHHLPVVVMLAGVPNSPAAWPHAGFATATADGFAATHRGLAPILVFVDENGSITADSECVDGPRGRA